MNAEIFTNEINQDANHEVKIPLNPNPNNLELYEVIYYNLFNV